MKNLLPFLFLSFGVVLILISLGFYFRGVNNSKSALRSSIPVATNIVNVPLPSITPKPSPSTKSSLIPTNTPIVFYSEKPIATKKPSTPIPTIVKTRTPNPTATSTPLYQVYDNCPDLDYPRNPSPNLVTLSSVDVPLKWDPVQGATKYSVDVVDETAGNTNMNIKDKPTTNSYLFKATAGHSYHWGVQAGNDCRNWSSYSGPQFFSVSN